MDILVNSGHFQQKIWCAILTLWDFDVDVVYENAAYDMGNLSICSKGVYDVLVTDTHVSGHLAVYEVWA